MDKQIHKPAVATTVTPSTAASTIHPLTLSTATNTNTLYTDTLLHMCVVVSNGPPSSVGRNANPPLSTKLPLSWLCMHLD